jgi:hypothetical protein
VYDKDTHGTVVIVPFDAYCHQFIAICARQTIAVSSPASGPAVFIV